MSKKSSKGKGKSTSSSPPFPSDCYSYDFLEKSNSANYKNFMRSKLHQSKSLSMESSPEMISLLENTCIFKLLRRRFDYNSELVYKFYANISFGNDYHSVSSYIQGTKVHFSVEDFTSLLHIPCDGPTIWPTCDDPTLDWISINQTLSGSNFNIFKPQVNMLNNRAKFLQHFVRICVVQKAGDRTRLTTPIALVTYYLMTGVSFDVVHTIVHQISKSSAMWNPKIKKFPNLCFGHIIAYLLKKKYGLVSPLPEDSFTYSFAPDTLVKLKTFEEAQRAQVPHQERQQEQEHPEQEHQEQEHQEHEQEHHQHYDYHTDASMHDAAFHYADLFIDQPHFDQPHPEPSMYEKFIGVGERIETTLMGLKTDVARLDRNMLAYGRQQDYMIRRQDELLKSQHDMQDVVEGLARRVHYVLDRANLPNAPQQGDTHDLNSA